MQLRNVLASDVLLEMAYTQKKAERVITGLEKPINDHLLKLWTNTESPEREKWLVDLFNWIEEIGEIVLRPANTRPPHIFYYRLLFFEPFGGGAEVPNVIRRLRRLDRRGFKIEVEVPPQTLVNRLQTFHRDLSSLCASRLLLEDQIHRFLTDH